MTTAHDPNKASVGGAAQSTAINDASIHQSKQVRMFRPLNSLDWRNAIVEVILIAVGVLIAIAASEWQSDRAARKDEIAVLTQIISSLTEDRDKLARWCLTIKEKEVKLTDLRTHLRAQQPYTETLDAWFGSLYGFNGWYPNRAAYESLKSQGIALITDFSLRKRISEVYEETYSAVDYNAWLEQGTVLDLLRPYYLQNFTDIRFHQNATPIDYEGLLSDVVFQNLLDYRLQQVRGPHLTMCNRATEDMNELLTAIAASLE